MGYDSSISRDDISTMSTARKVTTVLSWAQDAGMDTGFITTTTITHATPGALYAHTYERTWEGDCEGDVRQDNIQYQVPDMCLCRDLLASYLRMPMTLPGS